MKATKTLLAVALSLIAAGGIIFCAAMTVSGWDFSIFDTGEYVTNTYTVTDTFNGIALKTDTADITVSPSDDGKCTVICHEKEKACHTVGVDGGVLSVSLTDTRNWYDYIGINLKGARIEIYLPQNEYASLSIDENTGDILISPLLSFGSVDITATTGSVTCLAGCGRLRAGTSTGSIKVEDIALRELDLAVSTGNITCSGIECAGDITLRSTTGDMMLTDISCKALLTEASTGDLSMKNVIASDKMSLERTTGYVWFEKCDAGEIVIRTGTGDVSGTLNSDKVFVTQTGTGRISVPGTVTGGKCEIITGTGNIKVDID